MHDTNTDANDTIRRRMHSAVTDPRVCLKSGPGNARGGPSPQSIEP